MAALRRVLERVPAARWDWRPEARSRSAGELAAHLAELPGWLGGMLAAGGYDLAGDKTAAARVVPAAPEALLERFDGHCTAARAALAASDDAALSAAWELRRDGAVVRSLTRAGAVRVFVLDHAIHHRGQLTVYLRLLGVPVPALYGSSADEEA